MSSSVLANSLRDLIEKDLILKAGINVLAFVHYQFIDLWLVKIPNFNLCSINSINNCDATIEDENNIIFTE